MMKAVRRLGVALFVACTLLPSLGCNKVEAQQSGTFQGVKVIELGNFVRVDIEAEGEGSFTYQGYNKRTGDAFRTPYDEWVVNTSAGEFRISDKGVGNGAVVVNGQTHRVPLDEHLVIDKTGKISTAPGGGGGAVETIPEPPPAK
jgi:hypothetical protein